MIPSYGATDNATALSTVGGAKTVTGIPPFSSARMTVFRRGIAAMLPPFRRSPGTGFKLHQQASETPIEEPFGIALVNLLPVRLGNVQAVDDLQRLTDVQRAAFRIEWRVGREHDLIGSKELQPAHGRRPAAEDGRVGPEHLEVIVRPLVQ